MSASKNDIIEEVKKYGGYFMAYKVNFKDVGTVGLETSPVADSLAGLRANEARYFWNKYKFEYLTYPAHEKADEVALFEKILLEERNLKFSAKILEVAIYENDELYWPEFYYEDGMVLNYSMKKWTRGQETKTGSWNKVVSGYGNPQRT